MSWRTVIITGRCKLDLQFGCMVVRSEDTKRVLLDEISVIIVENSAVAVTGCLLNEIARRKIKLIFCDEKHNPMSELVPIYGSHDCSAKIRTQIVWDESVKEAVWTAIVTEKIRKQAKLLQELNMSMQADMLYNYISEIETGDITNREGHAAKVYFNALFGVTFSRNADNPVNAALNYGYSLILSAVNREVCANGYLTQLGLFHDNMFNHFNLSCDIMEPFRIAVDRWVYRKKFGMFESEQKHEMAALINSTVIIDESEQYLYNAIRLYVRSVFEAINSADVSRIKSYSFVYEKI